MLLLQKRYSAVSPHTLQLVPDGHGGDLGMEAFSHDGNLYQCYAAEEPISIPNLYGKQRDKLTTDLGKLRTNQTDIAAMVGSVVFSCYVFIVHRHESKNLVAHAVSKAEEVRDWGLPFIGNEFRIMVETLDDYRAEQAEIYTLPAPVLALEPVAPEAAAVWVAENASLYDTAREKLGRIVTSDGTLDAMLESLMKMYLAGENSVERLRSVAPDVHAAVLRTRSNQEDQLVLRHPPSGTSDHHTITAIADELAAALVDSTKIDLESAQSLAWATVMDWLIRCPLDFGATA